MGNYKAIYRIQLPYNDDRFPVRMLTSLCRWVRAIGANYWSHAYFPYKLYDLLTSNVAESMNNCLRMSRKLSIVAHYIKLTITWRTKHVFQLILSTSDATTPRQYTVS